jgi:DNA-binding response OmpR family regulator
MTMKVLVADDDVVSVRLLSAVLTRRGYEVLTAGDGNAAWDILTGNDPPPIALLDWAMPGVDGVELCRRLRARPESAGLFLVMCTGRDSREDIVTGLRAGANDYIAKPFDPEELDARLGTAARMIRLQAELERRVREFDAALGHVRQLSGLLPICSYCKKVRDDDNYWHQVEAYVARHSEARFSHGVCPDCLERHVKPELARNGVAWTE